MPKHEKFICSCGAKYSTEDKLEDHLIKSQFREAFGHKPHKAATYMCHGTKYAYGVKED